MWCTAHQHRKAQRVAKTFCSSAIRAMVTTSEEGPMCGGSVPACSNRACIPRLALLGHLPSVGCCRDGRDGTPTRVVSIRAVAGGVRYLGAGLIGVT